MSKKKYPRRDENIKFLLYEEIVIILIILMEYREKSKNKKINNKVTQIIDKLGIIGSELRKEM